ncbi:hypothetical protein [Desulfovirgula thermocuniculi]|uniref:hypothetical protein n=1 Tax=Desulfovirgula thermocuniculi TaxID=348842 RepID=UPI0012EB29D5|nr:hypothetical protein [Desulfovirgula thermocuniculi]
MPVVDIFKRFLLGETGESVPWIVVTIAAIIIIVTAFLHLRDHVKNAAEEIGRALEGK